MAKDKKTGKYTCTIDDAEIIEHFGKRVARFIQSPAVLRERAEMYTSYCYLVGHQYTADVVKERVQKNKTMTAINLIDPFISAMSGSQVIADKTLDIVAMDEGFDRDADAIGQIVDFCEYTSNADGEQSKARRNQLAVGMGATVSYLDPSIKGYPAGVARMDSIFPLFLFYDRSGRDQNLNTHTEWCGYADPMYSEDLTKYIASCLDDYAEDGKKPKIKSYAMQDFKHEFLYKMQSSTEMDGIDLLYHYFWREDAKIYDVSNPLKDPRIAQAYLQSPEMENGLLMAVDSMGIDPAADVWCLDKEEFKAIKSAFSAVGFVLDEEFKLEFSTRNGSIYYRAQIARGMVIHKAKSARQDGHLMVFYQGKYDNATDRFYGLIRNMAPVQDALNIITSDFISYSARATTGYDAYVKGAGEAIQKLIETKAHEDTITPLPANAEIIPKSLPNAPDVLLQGINMMSDLMYKVTGLPPEFFGALTTKDTSGDLYGQMLNQASMVLADMANHASGAAKAQGEIWVAFAYLMLDAQSPMPLPIRGDDGEIVRSVSRQNLARNYFVRIAERPMTIDEKQTTFNKLAELMGGLAPEERKAAMPVMMKYANLPYKDRKEIMDGMQPMPAPEPDPLNQALLDSQAKLQYADAELKSAQAQEKLATMPLKQPELEAKIRKDEAQAANYLQP